LTFWAYQPDNYAVSTPSQPKALRRFHVRAQPRPSPFTTRLATDGLQIPPSQVSD